MTFRYILRYFIDPGFSEEERIQELITFCKESAIEEVMFFICAEELSAGHPTDGELDRAISLGQRLKEALDRAGLAMSLNPWSTVYHNFRGRKLREGQAFRRMVGETGVENPVAVCPLCPEWQRYMIDSFSRLVRSLRPTTLWIEDDWRLMNHDVSLGWGGCFCTEHLRLFSEQVGQPVDREALLTALLAPGAPHPWRKLWMALSCDTLVLPLERLSRAVREAAPGTRVALMSSSPDGHGVEGRVWRRFQEAVGCEPTFITRPNMAPYTQLPALTMPPLRPRMTLANLSGPLEIYPELENSPRCGIYSKSARYSAWQMINCAGLGCHGITINHYDMLGNGIALDPRFGQELRQQKALLNAMAARQVDDRNADGVSILFSPEVSQSLQTEAAQSLSALMQESGLAGEVCAILGIAHRFTHSIIDSDGPIFVTGQTLRTLSHNELASLFARPVLLDADAVITALDLGLGDWIGVTSAEWVALNDSAYAYEEILEDDASIYGLARPRMTAQRCGARLLAMNARPKAEVLTRIHSADHTSLWPGFIRFYNPLGGVVISQTYAYKREAQFFMGYFNVFRRTLLQRLFWQIAPTAKLAMAAAHPLHLYRNPYAHGLELFLTNPTDDAVEQLVIDLPSGETEPSSWRYLTPSGQWESVAPLLTPHPGHDRLSFPVRLDELEGTILRYDGHVGSLPVR